MSIDEQATDKFVLQEIGERLEQLRLNKNLIRTALADQAGVSRNTIDRLESGNSVQLTNFIRVCRALGILSRFEAVFPLPSPSPVAQLRLQGKKRRRASQKRAKPVGKWEWGDTVGDKE
ncbi:hypothetical protein BH20ACI2_BH20ACI2_01520 [soil metagenome]